MEAVCKTKNYKGWLHFHPLMALTIFTLIFRILQRNRGKYPSFSQTDGAIILHMIKIIALFLGVIISPRLRARDMKNGYNKGLWCKHHLEGEKKSMTDIQSNFVMNL